MTGGVIAAGEGRRLREAGYTVPKPMVPVAGVPLIEGVIRNFLAADIASLTVILNEDERDCVEWLAGRFPALDVRFIVRTTASSLESFSRVLAAAPSGPLVVSTVDAWCRPADFVGFVEAARRRPADAVVLAVTPLVEDESPLWAVLDDDGRIRDLGGKSGNVVTAGIYVVPERVRALSPPAGLGRLREFLAWLVTRGEIVYGETIDRVVDVDRSADVTLAESIARGRNESGVSRGACRGQDQASSGRGRVSALCGWGIFRERTHSPGRESDDTEILRLTGKHLEARGYQIVLKSADELGGPDDVAPDVVFLMCETHEPLRQLAAWEARGIPHVNPVEAVLNTYRDRMIARFEAAGVPFVPSRLVDTSQPVPDVALPIWVKRGDVHNTREGDVVQAESAGAVNAALQALAARGIGRAVLQPHVAGDLVKFYGVGRAQRQWEPPWFQWFHHADQRLAGHPVDAGRLAHLAARAAAALGLEVYGGDAIVTEGGKLVLLDLNAWPSFARVRDEASEVIAGHLALLAERGRR